MSEYDEDETEDEHEADDEDEENRAPICPFCGVTALPAELSNVIDTGFICDNTDCDAYGEPVED